jgi:LacI family transcriptional regulator
MEDGIPLVSEGKLTGVDTNSVTFENRAPMKLATDYVIDRGHYRLAHLAANAATNCDAKERQLGFVESLLEHGIPITEGVIVPAGDYPVVGYQAAVEALRNPNSRPTALLCFNDMVVYRAAHELSLEIPGDLSVVGFDGMDFAELMGPPLTGIDVAPKSLGKQAAQLLLRVIRNEVGPGTTEVTIEPRLIERASVRRL